MLGAVTPPPSEPDLSDADAPGEKRRRATRREAKVVVALDDPPPGGQQVRWSVLLGFLAAAVISFACGASVAGKQRGASHTGRARGGAVAKEEPLANCSELARAASDGECQTLVGAATARLAGEAQIARGKLQRAEKEVERLRQELRAERTRTRPSAGGRLWHPQVPEPTEGRRKWAFVTMAHLGRHGDASYVWSIVALARQLHVLSRFPLLLLTDIEHFPDGTDISRLSDLRVQLLPLEEIALPRHHLKHMRWVVAWWKIQIWKLTDYDRLIWLDSDALVYRSIDYLFERPWMVAQRDDWTCEFGKASDHICSGIMLVLPNISDFYGLRDYASAEGVDLSRGDQGVIEVYFRRTSRPIGLLTDVEAAFGQCVGRVRSPYLEPKRKLGPVQGLWSIPAFVHKSGGSSGWSVHGHDYYNTCFQHNVSLQLYSVEGKTINVCHFNPLAAIWRTSFCEAVWILGICEDHARAYCSDECWLRGHPPDDADLDMDCGPVSSAIAPEAYTHWARGIPLPQAHEDHGPLV